VSDNFDVRELSVVTDGFEQAWHLRVPPRTYTSLLLPRLLLLYPYRIYVSFSLFLSPFVVFDLEKSATFTFNVKDQSHESIQREKKGPILVVNETINAIL